MSFQRLIGIDYSDILGQEQLPVRRAGAGGKIDARWDTVALPHPAGGRKENAFLAL